MMWIGFKVLKFFFIIPAHDGLISFYKLISVVEEFKSGLIPDMKAVF